MAISISTLDDDGGDDVYLGSNHPLDRIKYGYAYLIHGPMIQCKIILIQIAFLSWDVIYCEDIHNKYVRVPLGCDIQCMLFGRDWCQIISIQFNVLTGLVWDMNSNIDLLSR